MKLFISADIEGCAGVALTDETHKKESVYQRFAEEMTEEVVAACEAAHEAGADEIVVKDGHGDASNMGSIPILSSLTFRLLPRSCRNCSRGKRSMSTPRRRPKTRLFLSGRSSSPRA